MTTISGYLKMNEYVPLERPCPNPTVCFVDITYLEVYGLANIKSAKKRILVNQTKAARNKAIKSKVKTMVKKVEAAVEAKDAEAAKAAFKVAVSEINKAGSKGVYHKNTCSRKISRLAKAVNGIA